MGLSAGTVAVSVIMPAYQAEKTIGRAIDSIVRQTMPPFEVVIVDDGSSDRTVARAQEYARQAPNIRFHIQTQPNRGAGAARNAAIALSSGDYLAFLDADDEWLPTKLERSLAVLVDTGSDLVSHDFISIAGDTSRYVDCARHFRPSADTFVGQLLRGFVANTTVVARRETVAQAGGFDPSLRSGQDYELWLAVSQMPEVRLHVFPEALTRYHATPGSITTHVEQRRECALRILRLYAPVLRKRTRWYPVLVPLRAIIIHLQAAMAHWASGRGLRAMTAMLRAFPEAIRSLLWTSEFRYSRPNFLHHP